MVQCKALAENLPNGLTHLELHNNSIGIVVWLHWKMQRQITLI